MKRLFAAALALTVSVGTVAASGVCAPVVTYHTPHATPHHQEQPLVYAVTYFQYLPAIAPPVAATIAAAPQAAAPPSTANPSPTPQEEGDDGPPRVRDVNEPLPVSRDVPPRSVVKAPPIPAVFRAACASCHTGPNADGGFTLFDAAGRYIAPADPFKVFDAVASGRMPKKSRLTPAQRDEVRDWVRSVLTPKGS